MTGITIILAIVFDTDQDELIAVVQRCPGEVFVPRQTEIEIVRARVG